MTLYNVWLLNVFCLSVSYTLAFIMKKVKCKSDILWKYFYFLFVIFHVYVLLKVNFINTIYFTAKWNKLITVSLIQKLAKTKNGSSWNFQSYRNFHSIFLQFCNQKDSRILFYLSEILKCQYYNIGNVEVKCKKKKKKLPGTNQSHTSKKCTTKICESYADF